MSIELDDTWVLCQSSCGTYRGFFNSSAIPPDYAEESTVIISRAEFLGRFYIIEDYFYEAWQRTEDYFKNKYHPLECEFEPIDFSLDEFKRLVLSALISDCDEVTLYEGHYDQWAHLLSLISRRDSFSVNGDNKYCVDDALVSLGLLPLAELEDNYYTKDVTYTRTVGAKGGYRYTFTI